MMLTGVIKKGRERPFGGQRGAESKKAGIKKDSLS